MTCRVPGCYQSAGRYGALCNKHKTNNRRHGDPLQAGITASELKPFLMMSRGLIERNAGKELWRLLEEQWRAAVADSQAYLEGYFAGRPGSAIERRAHSEIAKVGRDVNPLAVIETVIALCIMQEIEPRRFRSDRAYRFQLVRRVRRLTDVNVGEYWDQQRGRTKRVYRDLPPRVTEVVARVVIDAIGAPALYLAQKATEERREAAEAQKQARQRLSDALAEVR